MTIGVFCNLSQTHVAGQLRAPVNSGRVTKTSNRKRLLNFMTKTEVAATLRLAAPVMLARSGMPLMVIVDTAMVGRVGADELAYLGLGVAPTLVLILAGVGILQGGLVLVAQAFGACELRSCGAIWRVNLIHAAVIGIVFGFLALSAGTLARAAGIAPDLAAGAGAVATQMAWGVPGMLLFIACQYFLEGIKRPLIGMTLIVAGNIANVGLNGILVYGWGGLTEPLGAVGATFGTSLIRWLLFLGVITYVLTFRSRHAYGIHLKVAESFAAGFGLLGRRIRAIGAPTGFLLIVESTTLASLAFMAGRLGVVETAAHQITINIVQFFYMMAIGMAAATSVRVAHAVGDGDQPGIRSAGLTGIYLMICFAIPLALGLSLWPARAAAVFIADPEVIAIARRTVTIAGLMVIFHTAMAVLLGALRGTGDVRQPLIIQLLSYWLTAGPLAYYLAIAQKMGVPGLILGLFIGVLLACALLAVRFWFVTSRHILRQ